MLEEHVDKDYPLFLFLCLTHGWFQKCLVTKESISKPITPFLELYGKGKLPLLLLALLSFSTLMVTMVTVVIVIN